MEFIRFILLVSVGILFVVFLVRRQRITASYVLLIGAIIFVATLGFVTVNFGNVGIVTRFGGITDRVLEPGLHYVSPLIDNVVVYNTKKILYETMNQENFASTSANYFDFPVDTTTNDGQQVRVRYTIRFSINPAEARNVAERIGTEEQLVETIIKATSRVEVRNSIRNFTAEQLYSGDITKPQEEIASKLEPIFTENGILLDTFGIRQVEFNQEYVDAIEAKQIEKEKVQTEEFRAQQEEFRKQAAITKAEGEAQAQQLQRETLSPELLRKLWIEKWNGILPTYLGGEDTATLLQLQ